MKKNITDSGLTFKEEGEIRQLFSNSIAGMVGLLSIKRAFIRDQKYAQAAFIRDLEKMWNYNLETGWMPLPAEPVKG